MTLVEVTPLEAPSAETAVTVNETACPLVSPVRHDTDMVQPQCADEAGNIRGWKEQQTTHKKSAHNEPTWIGKNSQTHLKQSEASPFPSW